MASLGLASYKLHYDTNVVLTYIIPTLIILSIPCRMYNIPENVTSGEMIIGINTAGSLAPKFITHNSQYLVLPCQWRTL